MPSKAEIEMAKAILALAQVNVFVRESADLDVIRELADSEPDDGR